MAANTLKEQLLAGVAVGAEYVCARSILIYTLCCLTIPVLAAAQANPGSANFGSVPSGPASKDVLHLTLRDAVDMAVRFNLGEIESGENTRIARGQRLRALSALLPLVSASASENVEQFSKASFGISFPGIPSVLGPFSYSTAQASATVTLFSLESIRRFRAARSAEEAAQLTYSDTLDVITLIVGNAYLQIIQEGSRITAKEAQVRNAQALYDQAAEQLRAGTSPKIDV